MGLRRWTILILAIAILLAASLLVANTLSGPYDVGCQTTPPHGFKIVLTSTTTGNVINIQLPAGGCPAS